MVERLVDIQVVAGSTPVPPTIFCEYSLKQFKTCVSKINLKFNNQGISFIEIIIAISLMAGLGLIAMKLTNQSDKSNAKNQFDADINLITKEIHSILSDPNKCLTTFTNATQEKSAPIPTVASSPYNVTHPVGIAEIPSTSRKYTIDGGPYGKGAIKIDNYKLDLSASPDPQIIINFKNKSILGFGTTARVINLYVEKNDSSHPGLITFCKPSSSSYDNTTTQGSISENYFPSGVKIGDETQATTCNESSEGTIRYNKSFHGLEFCGYNSGPPPSYLWKRVSIPPTSLIPDTPKVHSVSDGGGSWSDDCPTGYFMTGVGVYGNTMYTYCSKLATDGSFNFIPLSMKPQSHAVIDGGSAWSDNCNVGHVMTGISISNNMMKIYCSSISKDYLFHLTADPSNPKSHSVNDGGGNWSDNCSSGSFMTGFSVGDNKMTLQCAKIQTQ